MIQADSNDVSIPTTLIIVFSILLPVVALFVWQIVSLRRKDKQRQREWDERERKREYDLRPVKSETWIEAREKQRRGEFQRKAARRMAISLERDMFELECGHRWPAVRDEQESYECKECLDAWVKAQPK
jgi:predicted Holliday junction resolvase-like endonuclease